MWLILIPRSLFPAHSHRILTCTVMVGLLLNCAFGTLCVCTVSITGSDVMMLGFTHSQEMVILSASQRRSLPVVRYRIDCSYILFKSVSSKGASVAPVGCHLCMGIVDHAVGTFGAKFQQTVFCFILFLGCPS